MKNTNSKIPPILLMLLIFAESSIPMDGGPDNIVFLTNLDPNIQNLLHIPLYGILVFLWLRSFCVSGKLTKQMAFYSLMITISYGCLDEVHQSFVRGRYGGFLDILFNTAGAVSGLFFFWYLQKKRITRWNRDV